MGGSGDCRTETSLIFRVRFGLRWPAWCSGVFGVVFWKCYPAQVFHLRHQLAKQSLPFMAKLGTHKSLWSMAHQRTLFGGFVGHKPSATAPKYDWNEFEKQWCKENNHLHPNLPVCRQHLCQRDLNAFVQALLKACSAAHKEVPVTYWPMMFFGTRKCNLIPITPHIDHFHAFSCFHCCLGAVACET